MERQSAVSGVTWNQWAQKWRVQLTLGGKKRYLGLFKEEADATEAVAVCRAAAKAGRLDQHLQGLKKKHPAAKVFVLG